MKPIQTVRLTIEGVGEADMPAEFMTLVRMVHKRFYPWLTVNEVAGKLLDDVLREALEADGGASVMRGIDARRRYCEAEGVDPDDLSLRSCRNTIVQQIRELRRS